MMICIFSTNFLYIPRVNALSDSKQFVLEAWTLVNEGYYDPERLDEINGRGLDKKHYRNKLKQVMRLIIQLKIC